MTNDIETRAFDTNFEIRETQDNKRLIIGTAAPYGEVINVGGYKETFERGAFGDFASTPLFYGHAHGEIPVGVVNRGSDTDNGYEIEVELLDTPRGNEVYAACRAGALKAFSVGFTPVKSKDVDGVTVRTAVKLVEVSIVPFPAYKGAQFSEVRSDSNTNTQNEGSEMTDFATDADLTEVRNSVEDIARKVSTLEVRNTPSNSNASKFNSLGEFVKGLAPAPGASRTVTQEDAEFITRAYTGAQTSDNLAQAPTWIQRDIKLIQQNRNVLELFGKDALPAEGMSVNYPVFTSVTGDVAVQATEGADLTYIELVTGNASASVATYGGYSSLSRQVIERNNAAYLNKVLQVQKLSYAKVTNGAVRTLLNTSPASYNQSTVAFANKGLAKTWVNAALAGTDAIATNSVGLSADVWIMSFAAFQDLAAVYDTTNRPVFALNGDGANTVGSVDIRGVVAKVAGLPVVVDHGLTGTDSFIVSREAITVLESGPFNLADENIINLTKDFSIYGYLALTKNDVKGITRITHPTS